MTESPWSAPASSAPTRGRLRAMPYWVPAFTTLGVLFASPILWTYGSYAGPGDVDPCAFLSGQPRPLAEMVFVVVACFLSIVLGSALTGRMAAAARYTPSVVLYGVLTPVLPVFLTLVSMMIAAFVPDAVAFLAQGSDATLERAWRAAKGLPLVLLGLAAVSVALSGLFSPITATVGAFVAQRKPTQNTPSNAEPPPAWS